MSKLLKSILLSPSGGAAKLEYRKDANIFSAYNVDSSVPIEELVATLTSLATLSIADVRLTATGLTSVYTFHNIEGPKQVASPTSVYSLSTAVT